MFVFSTDNESRFSLEVSNISPYKSMYSARKVQVPAIDYWNKSFLQNSIEDTI